MFQIPSASWYTMITRIFSKWILLLLLLNIFECHCQWFSPFMKVPVPTFATPANTPIVNSGIRVNPVLTLNRNPWIIPSPVFTMSTNPGILPNPVFKVNGNPEIPRNPVVTMSANPEIEANPVTTMNANPGNQGAEEEEYDCEDEIEEKPGNNENEKQPREEAVPISQPRQDDVPVSQPRQEDVPVSQPRQEDVPISQPREEDVPVSQPREEEVPANQPSQEDVPENQPRQEDVPVRVPETNNQPRNPGKKRCRRRKIVRAQADENKNHGDTNNGNIGRNQNGEQRRKPITNEPPKVDGAEEGDDCEEDTNDSENGGNIGEKAINDRGLNEGDRVVNAGAKRANGKEAVLGGANDNRRGKNIRDDDTINGGRIVKNKKKKCRRRKPGSAGGSNNNQIRPGVNNVGRGDGRNKASDPKKIDRKKKCRRRKKVGPLNRADDDGNDDEKCDESEAEKDTHEAKPAKPKPAEPEQAKEPEATPGYISGHSKGVSACAKIKTDKPDSADGVYNITLTKSNMMVEVWCDMTTDGGGWTVIQKRGDFSHQEDFFRGIEDYKKGFGNKKESYWLGLDIISELTNDEPQKLRVDLQDFDGKSKHAIYQTFEIAGEEEKYKLTVKGYTGDAGDSLWVHNTQPFSTKDYGRTYCPNLYKGGWWYALCHHSNLNGHYLKGKHRTFADGVNWLGFRGYWYSLKVAEMKIKPRNL